MPDHLLLNGKKFYLDEIQHYSFRESIPLDGYEAKTLEFCKNWLQGVQEFPVQTSGSTGTPKLIELHRDRMEASARRTLRIFDLQPEDRVLVCLNTEYIAGMMMLVRGLVGNLHLTIIEPLGNPLASIDPAADFDFVSLVPLQLQTILEQTPEKVPKLNQMKAILLGGAPIAKPLEEAVQAWEVPVYQSYGMTETISHIAVRRLNGKGKSEFYTAPPEITLGQDDRGCLTIAAEVTGQETLVTNDLVELGEANSFRWLGRADNTVNSGGVKVQLEKVEAALGEALAELGISRRFFAASLPDEKLGDRLIAVLEGTPLTDTEEANLQGKLTQSLSKYEIPKQFGYLPRLPETATGKLDRRSGLALL
ncbi:AMP-binding protein [Rufibacter glacialis]|uniref:AMP-binding protein n=1 Tax=Rufibacter glacialis TaxID=1259555 RepID=A0A5M8QF53_9BACT|nr:AMP-binding protein [Rufibacter glacialis]KAA6434639.1 AMP-binding protein [Rufibacter glacialis]GGK71266.1 O-succinylbenzoic acid--CoA ligase [Rufibacter glacialis]